jgi:aryl carrier-like protein
LTPELGESSLTRDRFLADVAEVLCVSAEEAARIGDPFDAGLDSVRLLVLAEKWRKMGARVGFVELAERRSLDEWWDLVR